MMISSLLIITLCSSIYAIPSYILYILIVSTMVTRKKEFGSHFYRFYVFQAVIELLEYPADLFGRRSVSIPEMYSFWSRAPPSGWFPTLLVWYILLLLALRSIVPIFMSVYRLTAAAIPTRNEEVWNRIYPYCILITLILGFLSTCTLLYGSTIEHSVDSDGQQVMGFLNNHHVQWYRVSTGICTFLGTSTITSFISYVTTLWILKGQRGTVRKRHINVKQEYRLTVFMMLLWSTQVYTFATQFLFFFRDVNSASQQIFITELNYYGIELGIFLNPWFMVFCNKILRKELVLAFIPCLKKYVQRNSSITHGNKKQQSAVKITAISCTV